VIAIATRANERRIVLFPYGQPSGAAHRERCSGLVVACGGDPARMIDAPTTSLERFVSYVEKIRVLRDGAESPLVILTRTNPLALTVLNARRQMERQFPLLASATWAVYVAPDEDPFFSSSAQNMGRLDSDLEFAPIWKTHDRELYLVLSPLIRNRETLQAQIEQIDMAQQELSGMRPIVRR